MPERNIRGDLGKVFVVALPLLGEFDAEPAGENFANGFQRHALDLGVAQHDKDPAEEADATVKAERTAGGHTLHHGEEGGGNDQVGGPTHGRILQRVSR